MGWSPIRFWPVALAILLAPAPLFAQIIKIPFEATNVEPLEGGKSYYGYNGTKATLNDVTLESDTMLMLGDQGRIIAEGNVKMTKSDLGAVADRMTIDYFSGYFEMQEAQGYFVVSSAPNDLFYFSGADLRGYPDRFVIRHAYLTSCPFSCSSEWSLRGSKALVKSGKSMEMWNAVGYIGPVPVFYLPYLYIDLHQRQSKWYLRPGKTKVEGKFVDSMYTFAASPVYAGALLFHYSEKRGNRYGLNQGWRPRFFGKQDGHFNYNWQDDKQSKRARQDIKLDQAFPLFGTKGSVAFSRSSDYSLNVGTPDTNNSTGNFQLNGKKTTLKGNFNQSGGRQKTRNLNSNFTNSVKLFGLGLQSTLGYASQRTGSTPQPQTLDVGETLNGTPSHLLSNWSLRYQKQYLLSNQNSQQSFFSTTQSPLLNASFNPKLWQKNLVGKMLFLGTASMTLAVQGQGTTKSKKKIFFGDTEFQQRKSFKFGKPLTLDLSNRFKQGIYGSGDARYQVFPAANLGWAHTKTIRSTISFNYNQQHGRDPFLTGQYSKGLNASYQFTAAPRSNKWNYSMGTGFNFLQHKFSSPLTANLTNFRISRRWGWMVNANTGFDLHKGSFTTPLTVTQRIVTRFMNFDFSYNYDLQKQHVKTTQGRLELLLVGGWQLLLQETHNSGSRGQGPLFQSIVLNKMNCCTGYQLVYNAKAHSVTFNWFISAFPSQMLTLSEGNNGLLFQPPSGLTQLEQGTGGIGGIGGGGFSSGGMGGGGWGGSGF